MSLWSSLGRKSLPLSGKGGLQTHFGDSETMNSKVRDTAFKLATADSFPLWKHLVSLRQNLPCCTETTHLIAFLFALGDSLTRAFAHGYLFWNKLHPCADEASPSLCASHLPSTSLSLWTPLSPQPSSSLRSLIQLLMSRNSSEQKDVRLEL